MSHKFHCCLINLNIFFQQQVKGHSSEEKLIGAAKQVAGSTAQLLLACKVKADPDSRSMKRLEAASNAVRKATDNLVKAAQQALEQEEEAQNIDLNKSAVNSVVEVNFLNFFSKTSWDLNTGQLKPDLSESRLYMSEMRILVKLLAYFL